MNLLLFYLTLLSVTAPSSTPTKEYIVKRTPVPIEITGKGDNSIWKTAVENSDFSFPWERDQTPSFTSFRALHHKEWLYLLFTVHDRDIKLYVDTNEKREAVRSDRAEIFIRRDSAMSPYYCLEIDALARVFDCQGEFYRKLDTKWTWPAGQLIAKSNMTPEGYTVEVAISKTSLVELGLISKGKIEAGLFRADCVELNGKEAKFRWISWVQPDTPAPDFHTPSAFGSLILE